MLSYLHDNPFPQWLYLHAHIPPRWECGTLDLLVETDHGLVLVDTGLGMIDYVQASAILKVFTVIMRGPLDLQDAAIRRVARLGHKPQDVLVLTHMFFDHCGGWPFQTSDAAALFNEEKPDWLICLALGPRQPRIRQFAAAYPRSGW